jgi:hypothetical protein
MDLSNLMAIGCFGPAQYLTLCPLDVFFTFINANICIYKSTYRVTQVHVFLHEGH